MNNEKRDLLILGNWKMNGGLGTNITWVNQLRQMTNKTPLQHVSLGVFPPFPYLYTMRRLLPDSIAMGAQDVSGEESGAFTGETSATMLRELECRYVLAGHSERRQRMSESDETVAQKVIIAKQSHLTPVMCVGETLQQRENGETFSVIESQLTELLKLGGAEAFKDTVIAYEPVWAIGSGLSAKPDDIVSVHTQIKSWLTAHNIDSDSSKILYGGSMNDRNCAEVLALPFVDGGLIGGASLHPEKLMHICRVAERIAAGDNQQVKNTLDALS